MADRGKVIKRLENMLSAMDDIHMDGFLMTRTDIVEMLELLKVQDPVFATVVLNGIDGSGGWWFQCPTCKMEIEPRDKFCKSCGRAVKWDG